MKTCLSSTQMLFLVLLADKGRHQPPVDINSEKNTHGIHNNMSYLFMASRFLSQFDTLNTETTEWWFNELPGAATVDTTISVLHTHMHTCTHTAHSLHASFLMIYPGLRMMSHLTQWWCQIIRWVSVWWGHCFLFFYFLQHQGVVSGWKQTRTHGRFQLPPNYEGTWRS